MAEAPRVLFVSKPIGPPWHDGSKNLVRDVAVSLERFRPTVMTTLGVEPPSHVAGWPVYESAGGFAPAVAANARVLLALARARGFDVWHFVFAPNWVSSAAAHAAISIGRRRGLSRVVQTIASRPKQFVGLRHLLFGDIVVAQSEWTRGRLLAAGADGKRLVVIPPCARPLRAVSQAERSALRERLEVPPRAPLVVYAGDLEVSSGAETTARAIPAVLARVPEARFVFACRKKTPRAEAAEGALRESVAQQGLASAARFVGEMPDLAVLIQDAAVMVLPVDDLYGKVDVPLVVIEALAAGIPLVLARGGPLESVHTASFVEARDDEGLAREVARLLGDAAARGAMAEAGRALYGSTFSPAVVARRYESVYRGS